MDLLDAVANKLEADGLVGAGTGWTMYKSYLPDSPAQAVAVYEMPGVQPDQTQGIAYEYPSFQIFVRGGEFEYGVARAKIREIYNSLNNADVTGFVYVFASDSGPMLEGYDKATNRPVLFWSFNTMKSPDPMIISGSADIGASTAAPISAGGSASRSIEVPSAVMGFTGS